MPARAGQKSRFRTSGTSVRCAFSCSFWNKSRFPVSGPDAIHRGKKALSIESILKIVFDSKWFRELRTTIPDRPTCSQIRGTALALGGDVRWYGDIGSAPIGYYFEPRQRMRMGCECALNPIRVMDDLMRFARTHSCCVSLAATGGYVSELCVRAQCVHIWLAPPQLC